jgi:hypothetical protein
VSDVDGTGNPLTEGLGHAARHAAEVAAVLAMSAQAAIRVRERQLAARSEAQRAELRADHAGARSRFGPALERGFATATATQAAAVWAAAQPWAAYDPSAARAAARAEDRLSRLVPDLMAHYQQRRAAGAEPSEAMVQASRDWAATKWAPLLDGHGAASAMSPEETLHAWHATRRWAPHDPEAAQALVAAEDHLRCLRPAAMAEFDRRVALGEDPPAAMTAVAAQLLERVWDAPPVVKAALHPAAAAAVSAEATAERAAAGTAFATPGDLPTGLDEHHHGIAEGAVHADQADTGAGRAAALAAAAYPQPITAAPPAPTSRLSTRPEVTARRAGLHRGRVR